MFEIKENEKKLRFAHGLWTVSKAEQTRLAFPTVAVADDNDGNLQI